MIKDPRRLAVVIPCYNKVYWTQKTINSLLECTASDLYLILVDDNSTDDTWTFARDIEARMNCPEQIRFYYHKNETNIGVNAAWNVGLRTAMALQVEYICIANNDLLFTEGWDIPLLDALDADYSLASPCSTEQALPADWPTGATRHVNPVSNVMNILGACFAFKPALIEQIGYFPEEMVMYYGDNIIQDNCLRLGLKAGHIYESYIHHFFCQTTKDLDNSFWFPKDTEAYKKYNRSLNFKFTIGLRPTAQAESFRKYLKPSLDALVGDFNTISVSDKKPAASYNEMLRWCKTPYLILMHEDIVFTPELLSSIQHTIDLHPDFGAIGLVGPGLDGINKWSNEEDSYEVETLDSCLMVVRKDSPILFNAEVFDDLHLYAEDYCAQQRAASGKIWTIKLNAGSKIDHASATWNELGSCWGEYPKYREIFGRMWPGVKTT